jgi:hypothetical protein
VLQFQHKLGFAIFRPSGHTRSQLDFSLPSQADLRKVSSAMKIYVAEVDGRPVAIFSASTPIKAAQMIKDPHVLRDDFVTRGLCADDDRISFRPASEDEIAEWTKEFGPQIMRNEFGPRQGFEEMMGVVYLVK